MQTTNVVNITIISNSLLRVNIPRQYTLWCTSYHVKANTLDQILSENCTLVNHIVTKWVSLRLFHAMSAMCCPVSGIPLTEQGGRGAICTRLWPTCVPQSTDMSLVYAPVALPAGKHVQDLYTPVGWSLKQVHRQPQIFRVYSCQRESKTFLLALPPDNTYNGESMKFNGRTTAKAPARLLLSYVDRMTFPSATGCASGSCMHTALIDCTLNFEQELESWEGERQRGGGGGVMGTGFIWTAGLAMLHGSARSVGWQLLVIRALPSYTSKPGPNRNGKSKCQRPFIHPYPIIY